MQLSLNGGWKVTHIPYRQSVSDILDEHFVPEGWLDADVPEDVHATLRKAGFIRGQVYNKNTDEEKWIEEADWVYYKAFYADASWPAKKAILDFRGLDTFCDIYLNGVKVGFGRNMHVPLEIDVAGVLTRGARNVLVVRFYSPIKYVEHMDQRGLFSITTSERLFARKAQMNYSWDFVGRCVTTGIWKDVVLRTAEDVQIDSYYLYTKRIEEGAAFIGFEAAPKETEESLEGYTLSVCLEKDGQTVYAEEGGFADFASLEIAVDNPSLWWPRPYGKPELYDFRLSLKKEGIPIEEKRQKFGIRTVEIIREDQGDGRSFIFAVNGRRLFIRGANWVPTHAVYTDISDKDYEEFLEYAVEGNISMLRIWGGGIYESRRMFELCDELGIMLWNDFMLACGIYPQDGEFLDLIAEEAEYVLKEYRNYTSLVIWTGDNENGQAFGWAGRPYEFQNDKIANVVIKEACRRLDPAREYFPTSPCSPDEFYKGGDNPSSPYQGDLHLYIMSADPGVNANRDYGKDYYKQVKGFKPRFMSEFGFVSLPEKDTFFRYNFLREPVREQSEMIKFLPFMKDYLDKADHESAIYYSQVFNSMALQYWIEYFRSLKWTCGGSLYWKFNDPIADPPEGYMYPSHMCSVDMYKKTKMTYYYTRRAYDDLIVTLQENGDSLDVYACSELLEDVEGKLVLTRRNFNGTICASLELDCRARKDNSTLLHSVTLAGDFRAEDKYGEYIKAEFITESGVFEKRYFYADLHEINKLSLTDAGLKIIRAERRGDEITMVLRTEHYARNVRLNILDTRAFYSDNYFEMDAGAEKAITIRLRDASGMENKVLYVEGENVKRTILELAAI